MKKKSTGRADTVPHVNTDETEYQKRLRFKKRQQTNFRRFVRGHNINEEIRELIGFNHREIKVLLEAQMLDTMNWSNYGRHWVVDHVVPFWLFDPTDKGDMKLLWHPENLMPMLRKDNMHKQGDLSFSIRKLSKIKGFSITAERLRERAETALKVLDKYLGVN